MLNPLALATRSLTVPDVGTVNVLLVLSVRCLLHVPPVKPHESSVPADISASIMYREPVLPLTKARPVSPAVRVPPHAMALPPLASRTWVDIDRATARPIIEPEVMDLEQPSRDG